jgi:uncharacterized membrane protein YphA (DoxX/SURF4 family)
MQIYTQKITLFLEAYADVVLRVGLSAVILWFSVQQFLYTSVWTAYIPLSLVSLTGLSVTVLVYLNAIFELVFGLMLLFGWQTRLSALLLAVHLFDIMYVVGYGQVGVRDFGLAVGTLVVFMNGPDLFCIQQKKLLTEEVSLSNNTQPRRLI